MIHLNFRQAELLVNYKRVERLYQEAKLQVWPEAQEGAGRRPTTVAATDACQRCLVMDFVFDRIADGRVLKALVIVDDGTHELMAIEVERAISGHGVACIPEIHGAAAGSAAGHPYG